MLTPRDRYPLRYPIDFPLLFHAAASTSTDEGADFPAFLVPSWASELPAPRLGVAAACWSSTNPAAPRRLSPGRSGTSDKPERRASRSCAFRPPHRRWLDSVVPVERGNRSGGYLRVARVNAVTAS